MFQFLKETSSLRLKEGAKRRQAMYCCPSNQTVDDVTGIVNDK